MFPRLRVKGLKVYSLGCIGIGRVWVQKKGCIGFRVLDLGHMKPVRITALGPAFRRICQLLCSPRHLRKSYQQRWRALVADLRSGRLHGNRLATQVTWLPKQLITALPATQHLDRLAVVVT